MLARTLRSGIIGGAIASASFVLLWLAGRSQGNGPEVLALAAGFWAGIFVAWGAFWLFGWGGSAVRALWLWGIVGIVGALLLVTGQEALVLYLASSPADLQPTPASIAIWGAGGLIFGASSMAIEIARRLRKEERSG